MAVMARVNGIYMREVGTFFQLIGNTDDIICIDDDSAVCTTQNEEVWDLMEDYFAENGITDADYDIGHIFAKPERGSGVGGIAWLGSLCDDALKHRGLSGVHDQSDSFLRTNHVAHELGKFYFYIVFIFVHVY